MTGLPADLDEKVGQKEDHNFGKGRSLGIKSRSFAGLQEYFSSIITNVDCTISSPGRVLYSLCFILRQALVLIPKNKNKADILMSSI